MNTLLRAPIDQLRANPALIFYKGIGQIEGSDSELSLKPKIIEKGYENIPESRPGIQENPE